MPMPVITFDTLKYAKRLKGSDVPDKQAEAEALAEVLEVNLKDLATMEDLRRDRTAHDKQARRYDDGGHRHRRHAGETALKSC